MKISFSDWFFDYGDDQLFVENTISQLIKNRKELEEKYNKEKDRNPVLSPANWPPFLNVLNDNNKIILKKWLFYRIEIKEDSVPTGVDPLSGYDVMSVDPNSFVKQNMTDPNFTWSDLFNKNNEYHARLAAIKTRVYSPKDYEAELTILKSYPNGLAWGRFEADYCSRYGKSMGHCGNAGRQAGDLIYTFFDQKTHVHYLTFIVNNGLLGEAKAVDNSKPPTKSLSLLNRPDLPSVSIQPYYRDFFLMKEGGKYILRSVKGGGYKPENNLRFEDLTPEIQEEVKDELPDIDEYWRIEADQLEKDAQKIYDDYVNDFKHVGVFFSVEEYDREKFYLSYSGYLSFIIPKHLLNDNFNEIINEKRYEIEKGVSNILRKNDVYSVESVDKEVDSDGNLSFSVNLNDDDEHTLENFDYFVTHTLSDIDKNYNKIFGDVYNYLVENRIAKKSNIEELAGLEIESEDKFDINYAGFNHLQARYDKDEHVFEIKTEIQFNKNDIPHEWRNRWTNVSIEDIKQMIKNTLYNYAKRIEAQDISQQVLFQQPEFQPERFSAFDEDTEIKIDFSFSNSGDYSPMIPIVKIAVEMRHVDDKKEINNKIKFAKMLDQRYDQLHDMIQKIIYDYVIIEKRWYKKSN